VFGASAGTLRLYVNGASQSSVATPTPWNATGNLQIGRGKWNGNPADYFTGAIDQVRVDNRALSDADVSVPI
jgi:hypothetical protein